MSGSVLLSDCEVVVEKRWCDYGSGRLDVGATAQVTTSCSPLALALAKTDMWEGHAGQTQAEFIRIPFTCLHVTVLLGIPVFW